VQLRTSPQFWVGGIIVALVIAVAVLAPWLAPHGYAEQDLTRAMAPPAWMNGGSWVSVLGTDRLGRDVLSRIMYGAQVSTAVGVGSVVLGGSLGTLLGLLAGYFAGWVDRVISRLIDIQLSFPPVFLAIAVMAAVGQTLLNVIVVLGLVTWVQYARVARGTTLSVREREFVLSARAVGAGHGRILFWHVLPSILSPLAVIGTVSMASMVLAEAALSFLGLGIQPPTPAWGSMVSEARAIQSVAWWNAVFPGLAIVFFVTGANLMGEGLRQQ
jgi:peptide/nickel transport system permease protein